MDKVEVRGEMSLQLFVEIGVEKLKQAGPGELLVWLLDAIPLENGNVAVTLPPALLAKLEERIAAGKPPTSRAYIMDEEGNIHPMEKH